MLRLTRPARHNRVTEASRRTAGRDVLGGTGTDESSNDGGGDGLSDTGGADSGARGLDGGRFGPG